MSKLRSSWRRIGWLIAAGCLASVGCRTMPMAAPMAPPDVPRELSKQTLPPYVVEPPDVLQIEVVRWDIKDGEILKKKEPIELLPQPIRGTHIIRPDGTVSLGVYGSVQVAGLTLDQVRDCVKGFLGQWFKDNPEAFLVVVDVAAYNSKSYYIVTDGAGYGEQVYRLPVTGSETVLDAVSQIQGLPSVASKRHIWVARRTPLCGPDGNPDQVMPIDWCGITQLGDTKTNYQIMPGDRIYVKAQKIITVDNQLAEVFSPFERIFGITLLGSQTYNSIAGRGFGFGN